MIEEMYNNLPPSEKKLASYIWKYPEKSILMTASELGIKSFTSGATVIRLCKSLKLKGFQELKIRIAGDIQKNTDEVFRDITPEEPINSIIKKVTNNSIQMVRETADLLPVEALEKSVEIIINASRIYFIGIGASGIVAQDAQQKFLRINKVSFAFSDVHAAKTLVANANKNDVVVGISFSGDTKEVASVLKLANEKSTHTISLTKYGRLIVSEQADINLYFSGVRESIFRSAATSACIAQLQVIDILFMNVATLQYDESVKHLNETREALHY